MSPSPSEFDLRCIACGWTTVCGPAQTLDWLVRHRVVKSQSDAAPELVAELFRTAADRFACPRCGQVGLACAPSEVLDDEAWGEPRRCDSCGASISPERLEVFPDATLCVACQNREERGELTGPAEYCPRCGSMMVLAQSGGAGITRYVMTCPACRRR